MSENPYQSPVAEERQPIAHKTRWPFVLAEFVLYAVALLGIAEVIVHVAFPTPASHKNVQNWNDSEAAVVWSAVTIVCGVAGLLLRRR